MAIVLLHGTPAQSKDKDLSELMLFSPHPKPGKKPWKVKNLGPVGIGIDLTKKPKWPTMVIANVEKGSPADKTGKLKKGQIIESINGIKLSGKVDLRIVLGDIITKAEATDGKISLKIKGKGEVMVNIPVMGSYSPTWPVNCKKSEKIVRQLADILAKRKKPSMGGILFLLSTGEEKDLAVVRRWMKNLDSVGSIHWYRGYMGPGVCEYYLRTGDKSVLPAIRKGVKELAKTMFKGGWSGRSGPAGFTYSTGTGQLHAAGVHCMTFLLLAKLCGVEVDDYTLQETLRQFYRFAGHGNLAYGDGFPEDGFVDNGKTSGLALTMQAATLLTPEGESSLYAKARDAAASKAFYATNWFHAAHTGGGIGEIWHHAAVGLMKDKRPNHYRSYLDTRRWVMDLSRRYDGGIGIAGMTDRYDKAVTEPLKDTIDFGTYFALTYTLPRKKLQLFGAPLSKYAKPFKLPKRPWGNKADDIFLSIDPIPGTSLSMNDILKENVPHDSSLPVMKSLSNPQVSDVELQKYMHHPEFGLRLAAIRAAMNQKRYNMVIPLLKAGDPRLRHLGLLAINGMFKGPSLPQDKLTPEMFDEVEKMLEDPNESWWVVQEAAKALARADGNRIAKHRDRLFELLENRPCTWTKVNCMIALTKVAVNPKYYKTAMPRLLEASTKVWNNAASYRFNRALNQALKNVPKEVKEFAFTQIKKAYKDIPPKLVAKSGAVFGGGSESMKERIADVLRSLPGGGSFINELPKKTLAYTRSGDPKDKYQFTGFKPDPKFVGRWISLGNVYDFPPTVKNVNYRLRTLEKKLQAAKKSKKKKKWKPSVMILKDGKKIKKGNRFWSEQYIIDNTRGEARKMFIKNIDGKELLFVEVGHFAEPVKPDAKNAHEMFIRD